MKTKHLPILLLLSLAPFTAQSGDVEITQATASKTGSGTYRFAVTLKHQDTGWEHFANKWEVRGQDGTLYGSRELLHPHVNEQPFTRSLSNVKIPSHIKSVVIRAYDSVHGQSPQEFQVSLPE